VTCLTGFIFFDSMRSKHVSKLDHQHIYKLYEPESIPSDLPNLIYRHFDVFFIRDEWICGRLVCTPEIDVFTLLKRVSER
jgi:hypothetical protein